MTDEEINITFTNQQVTTLWEQSFKPYQLAALLIAKITEEKGTEEDATLMLTEFLFYAIEYGVGQILLNATHGGNDDFPKILFERVQEELIDKMDYTYKSLANHPLPLPKYIAKATKKMH